MLQNEKYMRENRGRLSKTNALFVLATTLLLSLTIIQSLVPESSASETEFSDDFPGTNLDPRWATGGSGHLMLDGASTLVTKDFIDLETPWYGPWARAEIQPTSNFTFNVLMKCISESGKGPARVEARLLDAGKNQIYTFRWMATADGKSQIFIINETAQLYASSKDFTYSVFVDKLVQLHYENGELELLVHGALLHNSPQPIRAISFVELIFLKQAEKVCPPDVMGFDYVSISSSPATPPSPPTGLGSFTANQGLKINWTHPADDGGAPVMSYKIFRGEDAGNITYLTTVGRVQEFLDQDVEVLVPYHYQLTAINAAGESSKTEAHMGTLLGKPSPPTNITVTTGDHHALLRWAHPLSDGGSPVTNYSIYRGLTASGMNLLTTVGPILQYNDTAVEKDTTYYYRMIAKNDIGQSSFSYSLKAVVGSPPTIPDAPENLMTAARDQTIMLTWEPPLFTGNLDIIGYYVYRGNIPGGPMERLMALDNVLNYTDSNLVNGASYYYRVSAANPLGEGNRSTEALGIPLAPHLPSAPLNLTLNASVAGEITLSWLPPADDGGSAITNYAIWRGENATNMELIATVGSTRSFTDTGLESGKEYFYRVGAFNRLGEGEQSSLVSATTLGSTQTPDEMDGEGRDHFSLDSTIITLVAFVIAAAGVFAFMLRPSKDAASESLYEDGDEDIADDISSNEKSKDE